MKTKTFILFLLVVETMGINSSFSQSKKVKDSQPKKVREYLKDEQEKLEKAFPPPLPVNYPFGSLGAKIQTLYQRQAEEACGIKRKDQRLYIPREIVNGYGQNILQTTMIYDIPISAKNLLFLALTQSDISKINNGTFVESEYLNAKRVIGLQDNLVNYGESVLTPINGFPSLFYQKSCGCYFIGDLGAQVKAPIAELEASLNAETKKSTSITTITGKFFSPLYLIFRQNSAQSVYAHLLLWGVYLENFKNNQNSTDLLIDNGKYISEFNATLVNRANSSDQSINMNGRLSANISSGIFSANGTIQAGYENKVSFSLNDFNTSIHKLSDGSLSYALTELPKTKEINQKLQNSLNFKPQPSFSGYVTHLIPVEISRTLTGVPSFLCDKLSWIVVDTGYNKVIWKEKPTVSSVHTIGKEGEYPDCICKVTGFVNKTAIDQAIKDKGTLEFKIILSNVADIKGQNLLLEIYEPSVKVTDAPKILNINSEAINASKQQITGSTKISFNYPIQFLIDATGVKLEDPYKISNPQIEYVNKEQEIQGLKIYNSPTINGNSVTFDIRTDDKPKDYTQEGELSVPIKIKFSIQLQGGAIIQLVTTTINLSVPNLVEKISVETKVE